MINYEEFALRLEILLRKRSMTQKQLANRMFVSESMISGWKNGTRRINSEQLSQMADILGVSMDYLWLGKESTNNSEIITAENDLKVEGETVVNMIETEVAVDVAFERISENRRLAIMIQSFGTVLALVLVMYLGLSGAYVSFNNYPFWSYSLLCSSVLTVTFGVNAISATPFPGFRKFMLFLLVLFAFISLTLVLGLYLTVIRS